MTDLAFAVTVALQLVTDQGAISSMVRVQDADRDCVIYVEDLSDEYGKITRLEMNCKE